MVRLVARAAAVALAVALGLGLPAAHPAPVAAASAAGPKVVVIVGATQGTTSAYRADADAIVAEAQKYTSNVTKLYSPNATWAAVKAALQGASVVVYLGHGNGFPNPYHSVLEPTKVDGFGLNASAGHGDDNNTYYGESYIAGQVRLAPNAVVLLNHLCYAAGSSEPGRAEPTVSVAHQRIDNYAAGFIAAGARTVVADDHYGAEWWVGQLFTAHSTMASVLTEHPRSDLDNLVSWPSARSPGMTAFSVPDQPTSGFWLSMVGDPNLATDAVVGGDTSLDPPDFVVPGNASVGPDGGDVHARADLTDAATATLAPDTRVRVLAAAPTLPSGRVLQVRTTDGATAGFMTATDLVPRDSQAPIVSGLPAATSFTPNGDGVADVLTLRGTLTEPASWTVRIRDGDGAVVDTTTGSGPAISVDWDGQTTGGPAPEAVYRWSLSATDGWGNGPTTATGQIVLDRHPEARLAGSDRYGTAAAISAATFQPGVKVAYVATGANFPDALAGAAAAGDGDAPVLLVQSDAIPAATAAELVRLQPGRIVVLGGPSVVSGGVLNALKGYTTGSVSRQSGSDRYGTAAAISAATFDPGVAVAYVATGANFPDALAGAAAAGSTGGPVLLVEQDAIPDATAAELARLKPGRIVVLGAGGVISDVVKVGLSAYEAP